MGNCHWLLLSAVIWWKVCVSVWWVRAYYRHDMAVQAIPGAIVLCVLKNSCEILCPLVTQAVMTCPGASSWSRDGVFEGIKPQALKMSSSDWLEEMSGTNRPLLGLGRRYQDCHCNYTLRLSIREWADKSLPSHHVHGKVPHTSPASCSVPTSPSPPPTLQAKQNRPHNLLSCVTFCPKNTLTW